jgi:hypothetical protein
MDNDSWMEMALDFVQWRAFIFAMLDLRVLLSRYLLVHSTSASNYIFIQNRALASFGSGIIVPNMIYVKMYYTSLNRKTDR